MNRPIRGIYVTDAYGDTLFLPSVEVFETQTPTGLLDAQGNELVRLRPKMGFDLTPRAKDQARRGRTDEARTPPIAG